MDLAIKSYFVLAQLHENYIQLTLNQVVKTSSIKENASAIIIQDEIIQIENVNENMCKHVWNHIESSDEIHYCTSHEGKKDAPMYLSQNYGYILEKLKEYISEVVSTGIFLKHMHFF